MNELFQHMTLAFLGFFAVMNPIANTAIFVSLTINESKEKQIKTALRALTISFLIILAFAILGKTIFHLFGITLSALRITGGILVFLIGYQMLQGKTSNMHQASDNDDADISISPLAVPVLAGPGTIATAMNYSASGDWIEIGVTIATFALLCLITFVCFIYGQKIVRLIGNSGISIITRIMGLILGVIGTQMIITGVFDAINTFL